MLGYEDLDILKEFTYIFGDPDMLSSAISEVVKVIAVISFFIAALQCFLGYKLFKFWVAVCGFFTFLLLGGAIIGSISESASIGIFGGIILGILGAILAFKLYKVGVFLLCGFMGYLLGYILTQNNIAGLVLALIVGVISVILVKPVIIVSTGLSGGMLAGTNLALILGIYDRIVGIAFGIIFSILGIIVQFMTNRKTVNGGFAAAQTGYYAQPMTYGPVQNNIQWQPPQHPQYNPYMNAQGSVVVNTPPTQAASTDTAVICPSCGNQNKANSKFCVKCGTKLQNTDQV